MSVLPVLDTRTVLAFAESLGLCLFCEASHDCKEELVLLAVWDSGERHWVFDDCFVEIDANGHLTCSECKFLHGPPRSHELVVQFILEQRA